MATNGNNSGIIPAIDTTPEQTGHTLKFVAGPGVEVHYTGSAAELAHADLITATLIGNLLNNPKTVNGAMYIDKPGLMPHTSDWVQWRAQQVQEMEAAGLPITEKGYQTLVLQHSGALKFILAAQTAKEVIDKYGGKVPSNAKLVYKITGVRKNTP